jgi:CO/xanthine dehydrogenase Mo-binding subunit
VWASHKLPYTLRAQLAELIDRPESDVVIHPVTIGGDFGSKGAPFDIPLGYHLALQTGRPIKFVANSHDDLVSFSHRHPSQITLRTGVRRDGTITARDAHIVFNTGAYGALKPSEDGMLTGADYAGGPYRIPNLHVEAFAVYTNQPPAGYMRAPGHPQVCFAVETHMDLLARELGMDPVELRLRNLVRETADGYPAHASEVLETAARVVREGATLVTRKGGRLLSGRAVAICERGTGFGEGSSDVTVNPDGTVTLVTGLPDNGTGALTVIAQVVAEVLGLPAQRVHLVRGTTDALPTDVGSAADRMTNVAGHAAMAAAEQVREQLTPLAATMLGVDTVSWQAGAWQAADGRRVTVDELATEMVRPDDPLAHAQVTLSQPRSLDRDYCAQAAEVEVDTETGEVRLRRFITVQDVGTIINPLGHQGQIDGGLVQGIGYSLTEELVLEEGRIVNGHFGDYKLPTSADIPELTSINIPSGTGPGPFQAKAIGELSCVPTAAAIANAVANAIGTPILDLPITAERVLAALEAK